MPKNGKVVSIKRGRKPAKVDLKLPVTDLFLMALSELYPQDKLEPGIVIAYLKDKMQFYGSVCRYDDGKKQVLIKAYGDSAAHVIQQLAEEWMDRSKHAVQFAQRVRRRKR